MWSPTTPHLQLAWDATSLGLLKTCPRKYQLAIAGEYITRLESADLTWGRIYHGALETYERLKATGAGFDVSLRGAVRYVLGETWDRTLNRPWLSDLTHKTRETLIRSVIWYLEKYRDDPIQTLIFPNGQPAVEISFRLDVSIFTQTGESFLLCGHLDRVGIFEGQTWIIDYKTTGHEPNEKFFAQFNPHNQMSLYDVAGALVFVEPIAGIIIDACETKVGFSRFQRGTTHRTSDQRSEYLRDLTYWLHQAEDLALTYGPDSWPKNDTQCYSCPFRDVCAETPKMRQPILDARFAKRVWNPLKTREKQPVPTPTPKRDLIP